MERRIPEDIMRKAQDVYRRSAMGTCCVPIAEALVDERIRSVNNDMLSALKAARHVISSYIPWDRGLYVVNTLDAVDAAIAKAEGRA